MPYTYDAWGNVTTTYHNGGSSTPARFNPFKYRGYYHDSELGFYYLNSRYYDPAIGRFISADGYVSTGTGLIGYNMFAYCNNDPITFADFSGESIIGALKTWGSSMWWLCAADGPVPVGEIVYGLGFVAVTAISWVAGEKIIDKTTKPNPKIKKESRAKEKEETEVVSKKQDFDRLYYHATTLENAMSIMVSNTMRGSEFEGGFVYAWKLPPSKFAIENSGAKGKVLISFETSTPFIMDIGILNPRALSYMPVVSLIPGPIRVRNVRILGVR